MAPLPADADVMVGVSLKHGMEWIHGNTFLLYSVMRINYNNNTSHHLLQSLAHFNAYVSQAEVISIDELLNSPTTQKMLFSKQAVSVAV